MKFMHNHYPFFAIVYPKEEHYSVDTCEEGGVGVGGREYMGERGGGVDACERGGVGVDGKESI